MSIENKKTTKTSKRSAFLSVRLSPAERAALEAQAGNQPLSTYVKGVLLHGERARSASTRTHTDHAMLARILSALGKSQLSASLERLSYAAANGSLYVDNNTLRRLHQAFNDIAVLHYSLLSALGKRPSTPLRLPSGLPKTLTRIAGQEGEEP